MKLREAAQDILNLYNYFTGAVIADKNGIIVYYYNSMPELNSMTPDEVVGKNILQVYTNVKREESSLYTVLTTGQPILERRQTIENFKGDVFDSENSTFPIKSGDEIIGAVEIYCYRTYEEIQHRPQVEIPKGSIFNLYSVRDIVSESEAMEVLKRRIEKVAATDSTVLIYGETGTGKELVAQAIHTGSNRRNEKFIAQNCAAIPGNLLESILFGTVKGSYTDAKDRLGLFEVASGGTLFLDEIHAMEWKVQAKLLKAIEEQQIYRVGGTEPIPVDVRIIAALNLPPQECISSGRLREDLYYRLKVVQLNVPGLRERREDLDSLTTYFIDAFNEKMGKQILGVAPEVKDFFHAYHWPGNVRELRNVLECAFNFSKGPYLQLEDIDSYEEEIKETGSRLQVDQEMKGLQNSAELKIQLQEFERQVIQQVLGTSASMKEAAERLEISKPTLYSKMKSLGLYGAEEVKHHDLDR